MSTIIEKKYLIGKNGSVVLEGDSSPYISNSINRYQARLSFETTLNSNEGSLIYAIAFQSRKGIYTYLAQVDGNEYYCFVPNGALIPNSHFKIGLIALDGNIEYNTVEDANGTLIEIPAGKISYKYSTLWSLPQTVLEGAFEGNEVNSTETQTLLENLASMYVKKTDYATSSTPGIVKAVYTHGLSIEPNDGLIYISRADQQEIDSKTSQYRPVTPYDLDYAVKSGLTNCKNTEWSDDEKESAQELLGITELVGDIETLLGGI